MAEEMGMPEGMTEEQIDAMEDAAGTAAEEAYTQLLKVVLIRQQQRLQQLKQQVVQ